MGNDESGSASALRADLIAAGYTASGVRELWGPDADDAIVRGQLLPARRALAAGSDDSALAALGALFILGEALPAERVGDALPSLGLAGAERLGLVEVSDGGVRAVCSLRSHTFVDDGGASSWWIVSDLDEAVTRRPLRDDHVVGVGGASTTLLGLQPSDRVGTALDLGTGCGIQALLASAHADRVIATDISERALRFARLNAALNEVENIDFRLGDLFRPLAGETVDRLVSNPPFVVTPRVDGVPLLEYRDGGRSGDDLMTTLISELPAHLAPGGIAVLLGNWEYHVDRDGLDRMRLAARAAGLDAWVVERDVLTASQYAETWIRDGGVLARTPRFDELYAAWLEDFAVRNIDRIGLGYLILRRPRGSAPTLPASSGCTERWAAAMPGCRRTSQPASPPTTGRSASPTSLCCAPDSWWLRMSPSSGTTGRGMRTPR